MIRSSVSHFQLLKMIINEQHDLDKARQNVYILQKGLLFFPSSSKQGFSSPLALVWLSTTQKEFYETHHARIVTVPTTKSRNCKWERDRTVDINFVSKAGGVQWLQVILVPFCSSDTSNGRLNSVLL